VICLLLALKICHPSTVTLLRGNHEDAQVNALYGFRAECVRRCRDGATVWQSINRVFEWLPVAALVDDCVLCVHGGIGEQVQTLKQLKELPRPAVIDLSRRSVLNEILWSDPTDSDERIGCHPNIRGPNTVSYGPDRVRAFCEANGLKLIVRAHQCVQDGFEFCAHGRLLTVFSAPDYGARWKNDAAMLILNRELHVFPKVLRSRGRAASTADWVEDPKRPFTPPRQRPTQPAPVAYGDEDASAAKPFTGGTAGTGRTIAGVGAGGQSPPVAAAVPMASPVTVLLDALPIEALGSDADHASLHPAMHAPPARPLESAFQPEQQPDHHHHVHHYFHQSQLVAAELAGGGDDEAEGAMLAQQMVDTILD